MKIVLVQFRPWNIISAIIVARTMSKFVHAGVIFTEQKGEEMTDNYGYSLGTNNGYWMFDASESRGDCDWNNDIRTWGDRGIEVYNVPDSSSKAFNYAMKWIKGTDYDYFGVGLFGFVDPRKKLYCFEAVRRILLASNIVPRAKMKELLPDTTGYGAEYLRDAFKKAGVKPEYAGRAKDYKIDFSSK